MYVCMFDCKKPVCCTYTSSLDINFDGIVLNFAMCMLHRHFDDLYQVRVGRKEGAPFAHARVWTLEYKVTSLSLVAVATKHQILPCDHSSKNSEVEVYTYMLGGNFGYAPVRSSHQRI